MSTDYYGVLGVVPTATEDEIKRSYKKLAVKFHPDKTNDPSLHSKFLLINEAYETLKDATLRKTYDTKNGYSRLQKATQPNSFHGDDFNDGFRSHHGFSYYLNPSRGGGNSYFNWQLLNVRAYAEAYFRNSRQEKEDAAAAAAMAAKLAKKQMEEEMKRRRDAYMEEARRMREKEQLEEIEKRLREQKVEKERQMKEQERLRQENLHFSDQYRRAKQQAFQQLWHDNGTFNKEQLRPGNNSSEPIIVEDEVEDVDDAEEEGVESSSDDVSEYEDADVGGVESVDLDIESEEEVQEDVQENDRDDDVQELDSDSSDDLGNFEVHSGMDESHDGGFDDIQSEPPTAKNPDASFNHEHDGSDANGTDSSLRGAPETPNDGPEVVEIPEDGDTDGLSGVFSVEPKDAQRKPYNIPSQGARFKAKEYLHEQRRRDASGQHGPTSAKKPRFADMSELRDTLGTNLDDVSFDDMRDNLPETGQRIRRASGYVQSSFKRARTEFTDGSSRAQTLFTPINKLSARFSNSTISPSDLAPDVDERSIMFTATPPQVTVGLSLTHKQWDEYVQNIHSYERKFAQYRKAVLQYQMGRLEKDERHHNIIYSDTSCVEAYQLCLFNDMLILQNYHRTLLEFRETLKTFKRNCDVVNAMQILGNV